MCFAVQFKTMYLNLTAAEVARGIVAGPFPRFPRFPRLYTSRLSTSRLRGEHLLPFVLLSFLATGCGTPPEAEIEPPQVLTDSIPFVYPLDLWDHNISGQTVLLVRVNALGQVDSVTVDAGSGYPEFDSAAVQGARELRFIAARQGERRIPMWTKVPVRFARDTTTKMGIGGS
jgi:TonB family protein